LNKRHGFTLLELLAVIPMLAAISLVVGILFVPVVSEVPKMQNVVNQQSGITDMLRSIESDVDLAKALPDSYAGKLFTEKQLLIELSSEIICYSVSNGEILRFKLKADGKSDKTENWDLPDAKVSFSRMREGKDSYAVEVHTAVVYSNKGQKENKLANTHVFFLSAVPGKLEGK
jgi:type II secretory pathway pseudopilin PulG